MTDFTKINGIGKKTSDALNKAGITGFDQLAAFSAEAIEKMLTDQGVRVLGDVNDWIEQARELIPVVVAEEHPEIISAITPDNDHPEQWVEEEAAWDYDFGDAEFDDSFIPLPESRDGSALILSFDADEVENLKALRDTMTRYWGNNITVITMIRRMINERLSQHGYKKLSL